MHSGTLDTEVSKGNQIKLKQTEFNPNIKTIPNRQIESTEHNCPYLALLGLAVSADEGANLLQFVSIKGTSIG